MNKILVFDMDGTLADLYSVKDWLPKLRRSDPSPFTDALPLTDMENLRGLLSELKTRGYKVIVTTWTPKQADTAYCKEVRKAKIEWLQKYEFPFDEIHIVAYGTTKANCIRKYKVHQTLFDDNEKIRKGWRLGKAIDPENMISYLNDLIA